MLLPPDVNESFAGFTPLPGEIRYGLSAIKGLGDSTVRAIIEARKAGPFRSIFDFTERLEQGTINKRAFEGLVSAGAFDSLKPESRPLNEWRGQLAGAIDTALARAQRSRRAKLQGQDGLFGNETGDDSDLDQLPPGGPTWTRTQLLAAEKGALGFYITNHPLEEYVELLRQMGSVRTADLPTLVSGNRVSVGGIISDLQSRTTKKGDRFALFRIEDESGGTKCVAWPEIYRRHATVLVAEAAALITGRLELSDDMPPSIIVDQVQLLDGVAALKTKSLLIRLPNGNDQTLCDGVLDVLNRHPGVYEVLLEKTIEPNLRVRVRANSAVRVQHDQTLVSELKQLGCVVEIANKSAYSQ
jgi:DNA polymerase-3 subunit alpha